MTVDVRSLTDPEERWAAIPALSDLRIRVFRSWPYLYAGSAEYEASYLAEFVREPGSVLVIARDGDAIIGAATAIGCYIAVQVKAAINFDDSLDAYAVHGVGGTIGALLTGLLAVPALVPADYFPKSAEILASGGNGALFVAHVKAVLISYGFVGVGTAIILWIVGATCGLRVTPEEEERGLDFVAHGEEAYDPMTY